MITTSNKKGKGVKNPIFPKRESTDGWTSL